MNGNTICNQYICVILRLKISQVLDICVLCYFLFIKLHYILLWNDNESIDSDILFNIVSFME